MINKRPLCGQVFDSKNTEHLPPPKRKLQFGSGGSVSGGECAQQERFRILPKKKVHRYNTVKRDIPPQKKNKKGCACTYVGLSCSSRSLLVQSLCAATWPLRLGEAYPTQIYKGTNSQLLKPKSNTSISFRAGGSGSRETPLFASWSRAWFCPRRSVVADLVSKRSDNCLKIILRKLPS